MEESTASTQENNVEVDPTFITQPQSSDVVTRRTKRNVPMSPVTQSTRLLQKKNELREMDILFDKFKADYWNRMNECENRRLILEEKQRSMKEQEVKFEKFIKENEAKRARAEAKIVTEKKLLQEKNKQVKVMVEEIQNLSAEQNQLETLANKNLRYKQYMVKVIESGEHTYNEISEIAARYQTLVDARRDLLSSIDKHNVSLADTRKEFNAMKLKTQNDILIKSSHLNFLRQELEQCQDEARYQERQFESLEENRMDSFREFYQIQEAIKNIYSRSQINFINGDTVKSSGNNGPSNSNSNIASDDSGNIHGSASETQKLMSHLQAIQNRINDLLEIKAECLKSGHNRSSVLIAAAATTVS